VLGFWPQLLFVLIALYFAGRVFAGTGLGRWLLFFPVLMTFVPFVWHALRAREVLLANDLRSLSEIFLTLGFVLGLILLLTGILWAWRYAFSVFLFPLLTLLVYYFGPWTYLSRNLNAPLALQTNDISLFAALSALSILAYTLPQIKSYLEQTRSNPKE
jgi:MFS family permease